MAFAEYGKPLGITSENCMQMLASVPKEKLTYGLIGELVSWLKQYGGKLNVKMKVDIVPVVAHILSDGQDAMDEKQRSNISPKMYKVHKQYTEYKRRRKDRPEVLQSYCETLFTLRVASSCASDPAPQTSPAAAASSVSEDALQAKVAEQDTALRLLQHDVDRKTDALLSTERKLKQQRTINKQQRVDFDVDNVKQQRIYENRKLKRKETRIGKLKAQIDGLKAMKIKKVYVRLAAPGTKAEVTKALNTNSRRLRRQFKKEKAELEKKVNSLQKRVQNQEASKLKLSAEVAKLKREVRHLEELNTTLNDEVTLRQRGACSTRVTPGKAFTSMIRESCFQCLNAGVGEAQVSGLVERLFQINTGLRLVGGMPCLTSVRNMSDQMKELTKIQLRDALMQETEMTLIQDSTTKRGHSLVNVVVATKAGNRYLVGVKEMGGGDR